MIDIKLLRHAPETVRRRLTRRGVDGALVDQLLALDREFRDNQAALDSKRAERNALQEEVSRKARDKQDITAEKTRMKGIGDEIKALETRQEGIEPQRQDLLYRIPNMIDDSVPDGLDESANVEVQRWGEPPRFDFEPKAHHELGEALGIMDFERASKLAGSRFVLMRGAGAALERALINFMLDLHTDRGYQELLPPFLANTETLLANGNLPKFADQLFKLEDTDFYLIPTAEIPLTQYHRGEILDEAALPLALTAYTPCFRSEAGAAGKDTRGLIRLHQFDKVELVKVVAPETSFDELEKMVLDAERVLRELELPYRKVLLCAGDTGANSAKTYDLEVWFPAQGKYREISSCSNCTDYQARRGGTRFRSADRGIQTPHTLNGSGLAVGRTLAAMLENHQQADGSVRIPPSLQRYMGGRTRV